MDSKPLNVPGTTIHLIKSLLPILQCDAATTTTTAAATGRAHAPPPRRAAWACMDLAAIECR